MKTILTVIVCFLVAAGAMAQTEGTAKTQELQVSFITPLGTSGTNAPNTINKLSINLLAGYHAGLDGVELGGIANANREFVDGVQMAGITNINGGTLNGVQLAGVANLNGGQATCTQLAGIANINAGKTIGFQGAGVLNMATATKGLQLAGIMNIAEDVEGSQVAGVLNMSRKLNGLQFGLINIADTVESGTPIGFLSIVRNGFSEVEIGASESLNAYASLKLGVHRFYNIFSIGTQFLNDDFRWAVGYGIGSHLVNRDNYKVNLEAISYQINEGNEWTNKLNSLHQLKLTFAGGKSEHVQFFAGPTVNLMVSEYEKEDGAIGSDFAPYHFAENKGDNTNLKFWVGATAGLRFH